MYLYIDPICQVDEALKERDTAETLMRDLLLFYKMRISFKLSKSPGAAVTANNDDNNSLCFRKWSRVIFASHVTYEIVCMSSLL